MANSQGKPSPPADLFQAKIRGGLPMRASLQCIIEGLFVFSPFQVTIPREPRSFDWGLQGRVDAPSSERKLRRSEERCRERLGGVRGA